MSSCGGSCDPAAAMPKGLDMNNTIETFARRQIIEGLLALPVENQRVFKLMYGRNRGRRSIEDAELLSVEDTVAEIPVERLDWALQQVENTAAKIAKAQ